ncbi:putative lipoate-protein ligase A [Daldinia childiae]|uniref:putative lipoate-protein ligase A n=1 Tax=Daldinia childiae TaxID=326645 RepID=UPI00144573C5|nr:putative lipoate-protein ligase A [Daldinia childiae]KAF3071250.1 putative lipoate-protein ligase A [Daldinia childiae]
MALRRYFLNPFSRPRIRPYIPLSSRRLFSAEAVSHPANRVQVYISRATDPYLNLSIEHFLLQKSPPESVVLFLYTNRPCIVVGRNQNPWVEVNLGLLGPGKSNVVDENDDSEGPVLLVRRRSGGGTVFHDSGNVNYSVICPPAAFDRNKHAFMVVQALHSLGVSGSRVNERHDIVLDVPGQTQTQPQTFKISGSAYKLTRLRSLHHGTCLLQSPNLPLVGPLLRSPAAPFIKARGVESVRSPIRNVGVQDTTTFEEAVVAEFGAMYGNVDPEIIWVSDAEEALNDVQAIAKGYAELKSLDWIYTQTPQFTFSTHPTEDDPRPRPSLPDNLPPDFRAAMTVRHGQITEVSGQDLPASLESAYLHQITDWQTKVDNEQVGKWLNNLFGVIDKN